MKTPRSKDYRAFIREHSCCVCLPPVEYQPFFHARQNIQAAHTGIGGVGIKASDYSCIPLCHEHHAEAHQHGEKTFQDKHNIEFWRIREQMMAEYIQRLEDSYDKIGIHPKIGDRK